MIAPTANLTGHLAALDAVYHLGGIPTTTRGLMFHLSLTDLTYHYTVRPTPGATCPTCGVDMTRSSSTAGRVALIVRQEGEDEYVVGDPASGNFVVVPEVGARLVELFVAGRSVDEAAAQLDRETGEEIDAADFLEVLREAGITRSPEESRHWSVSRIPARWSGRSSGRSPGPCTALAWPSTLVMFVIEPSLRPTYEDTFVFPDIVLSLLVTNVVVIALTFLHEAWHAFAGAAVGVPSRLRLERRGIFPVLETDLSGLWALPPAKRYGPFLAGMAIDSVVLFFAVAPRYAWSRGWIDLPPMLIRILAMVVLSQVAKLAFQTLAYLRTDMYLVMATATGCGNLHQVTRLSLKRWYAASLRRAERS